MYASKYNITAKLDHPVSRFSHLIVNTLTGSIDALDQPSLRVLEIAQLGTPLNSEQQRVAASLKFRGYLYDNKADEENKVRATVSAMDESGLIGRFPVYFLMVTYNCNLACPYCFQQKIDQSGAVMTPKQVSQVFRVIETLAHRYKPSDVSIEIMGGEALLPGHRYKQTVATILAEAKSVGFRVRITSNGTFLNEYVNLLSKNNVESVQVTIDGPPIVQDSRRPSKGGDSTSEMLFTSVNKALQSGIKVIARSNIDHTNIDKLPALASYYERSGWQDHSGFFAYVSPVQDNSCLGSFPVEEELSLFEKYLNLFDDYPHLDKVFQSNNFGAFRYLDEALKGGKCPIPRVYRCEANVNQFVFDATGNIYPCLETAGLTNFAVGKYQPTLFLDEEKLSKWRHRHVTELRVLEHKRTRFSAQWT